MEIKTNGFEHTVFGAKWANFEIITLVGSSFSIEIE